MLPKGEKSLVYCVECLDVPANVECTDCRDFFCLLCFQWLHKKGKRKEHNSVDLKQIISKVEITTLIPDSINHSAMIQYWSGFWKSPHHKPLI